MGVSSAKPSGIAAVHPEARRSLGRHLSAVVVAGRELEILMSAAAIGTLVFDAHVGELHAVADDWKIVRGGPRANLVRGPIRTSGGPSAGAIVGLQETLIVALQFVIDDHSSDAGAGVLQASGGGGIRAIDLGVMRQFAGLYQPGVELLSRLLCVRSSIAFEQPVPVARQRHERGSPTGQDVRPQLDEFRFAEALKVSVPAVA